MGHEDERGINGVLVGVCGPAGLGVQANAIVKSIDSARKKQAGGVDVYEEYVSPLMCCSLRPTNVIWAI